MRRVAVITATSGVGRQEWLVKLSDFLGSDWRIVNFESEYFVNSLTRVSGYSQPTPLYDLLNVPEPFIRDAWDDAFTEFIDDIASIASGQSLVLSMHASIWSPNSTSPFPVINPALVVESGLKADVVLNIIDDVWDMDARLRQPMQLFDLIGNQSLSDQIDSLITLLEWRQTEFRASEMLAKCCGAPETILLSARHPIRTMQRLIWGDRSPRVYLSHPISTPRKAPGFPDTGLVNDIQRLAALLREGLLLFEPTGIDELRLIGDSGRKVRVADRWPAFLNANGEAEEPCAASPAEGISLIENINDIELERAESLIERIDSQVNWRDRQLIEQAESVVAIRPFSVGRVEMSRGVYEELRLHAILCERYSARRRGVIIHRSSDERDRRILLISKILNDVYLEVWDSDNEAVPWMNYVMIASEFVDDIYTALTYDLLHQKVREFFPGAKLRAIDQVSKNLSRHRRVEQPLRALQAATNAVNAIRQGLHGEYFTDFARSTLSIADGNPGYEVIVLENVETDYMQLADEIVEIIG